MAGPWDNIMKRLVKTHAKDFANWLMSTATFVRALDVELKGQSLYADALLELLTDDNMLALLHMEFQTDGDPKMKVRLMEYNMLASHQNGHCPVTTYVLYLRIESDIAESPCIRPGAFGEEVIRFQFRVIKLWEVPAEELLQWGWIGLLPLLTLTKGGKRPEIVNLMIDRLVEAGETDLLTMAQVAGGLVFKKPDELTWFKRRFAMLQDILRESWVYQEIGQEYLEKGLEEGLEKGREEGREEERQRELQRQREAIMSFVQTRFAEIAEMAKQHTDAITDPAVLQTLTIKLFAAQTAEEARRVLFEAGKH